MNPSTRPLDDLAVGAAIRWLQVGFCRFALIQFVVVLLMSSGTAQTALPLATVEGGPLPTLAPMLERVNPSVVNIATFTTVQVRNPLLEDPFFRRFFGVPDTPAQRRRTQSAGSGVVVDAVQGYIVTNNHVIEGADEITVGFSDGRVLNATLVGRDSQVDLAVVKVDPKNLKAIQFADSGRLRVGDFVVAIGNPFGLNQTVTSGIVSALGRSGLGIEGYEDFIQTDAPINPGNSGGALVDLSGKLVGINTAIFAPAGGNVGIGFAIPANMVNAVLSQLVAHGQVRRGYLGIEVQALNADLAEAFGASRTEGVVVVQVDTDSPAGRAGVLPGDVIIKLGERNIGKLGDYRSQEAVVFAGGKLPVTVQRNGQSRSLILALDAWDGEQIAGQQISSRLRNVQLQNFRQSQNPDSSAGVRVSQIAIDSPAAVAGLRQGDIIVGVNRAQVRNIEALREAIQNKNQQLLLRVYRNGEFGYIAIR
jgi:serine protease Do/serine protease DegQ